MWNMRAAAVLAASGLLVAGIAGSAGAQAPAPKQGDEQVLVFILDQVVPVEKFENPDGCYELPAGTHVVINDTSRDITLHASPDCGQSSPEPGVTLKAGHGAHELPAFGSFSA
ncbi:hypothetical protein [Saccharopolyspora griseoalba]|uniref:Uncharacterized protein n=1 Tax=Saccharopolyspora griseoalba TaxID=1431848 RepID=A0ABW2LM88_9PSEU